MSDTKTPYLTRTWMVFETPARPSETSMEDRMRDLSEVLTTILQMKDKPPIESVVVKSRTSSHYPDCEFISVRLTSVPVPQ